MNYLLNPYRSVGSGVEVRERPELEGGKDYYRDDSLWSRLLENMQPMGDFEELWSGWGEEDVKV